MGSSHRQIISEYRDNDMPQKRQYRLTDYGDSVRMTVMADAIEAAGIDRTAEITQAFYEEEGVLLVDLEGGGDE